MIPLIKKKYKFNTDKKQNHLTGMNAPALTAKHDAAYDQAINLFTDNLFSHTDEQRSHIYKNILKLLETAIQAKKSIPASAPEKTADPIAQYLMLLKDTIQAAYALVTHEMILFQEEKQLSNFIGSEIASQFRTTDEIFANSELNICHNTNELIEMAEPAMRRHRDRVVKTFQTEDLLRYKKSFSEFKELYKKLKP